MIDPRAVEATLLEVLSFASPQLDMELVQGFIRQVVAPLAEPAGFDEVTIDSAGNLVAHRWGAHSELPPLVWYTYGATYPPAGMAEPYPARRVVSGEHVALRGRGAAEQRSGLAAALVALTALACRERPVRGITLVTCVAGEMGNHSVVQELVRKHGLPSAGVVLAIATGGNVGVGNLGRVDVHVEITGRPCHSSDPSRGINAVLGAMEFCRRLQGAESLPVDQELGAATLAITDITSAPKAAHTIPARCRMTLDRRLLPGESPGEAVAGIAAMAKGMEPYLVQVHEGHSNLPSKIAQDHPLARAALKTAREVGLESAFWYRRAALDAGYFTSRGVPAIMWGPGDPSLAHTDEESVPLLDVVAAARAYMALSGLVCWDNPGLLSIGGSV